MVATSHECFECLDNLPLTSVVKDVPILALGSQLFGRAEVPAECAKPTSTTTPNMHTQGYGPQLRPYRHFAFASGCSEDTG